MRLFVILVVILTLFIIACSAPAEYKGPEFCKNDYDCVKQGSCCDCGLGKYVNTYNYKPKECKVECECEPVPSKGICEDNVCKAQLDVEKAKDYCESDDDCICGGIDREDSECFIGNKEYYEKYVDKTMQCPDFCSGIANHLESKCVDNKCKLVSTLVEQDLKKHWKCKNGLFVDEPTDCYDNSCKTNEDCVLKETEGLCGEQNISLPKNAFPAIYVKKRCIGEQCSVIEPSCMDPADRPQIVGAVCDKSKCNTKILKETECVKDEDCASAGCSGQLCVLKQEAAEITTTCEFAPEYECLELTSCGCVDGKCQFEQNQQYASCLNDIN